MSDDYAARVLFGNARKLFRAQSDAAKERNPQKCACEHEQTVIVKTKRRGAKRVNLGGGAVKHLSSCQHSELARTTQPRESRPTKKRRSA